ncbi:MAG TPA: 3-hydroxyacyl-CoA dehydrogenase family protein [Thermoanaerobaculia bacterium]|nr:3-hydroxyacyl-CoA dehydrogenase family protein [Thermoanaerobaculia bacterium]HUM29920.1 3-hydroxyacyl-CoA dehydrogenase family protein [Thermoanaerobaculia bacterium]HXK68213.1 3-hydroxyacyl-CoA dehydrogenase family protein [Thermoanaerobaculia bacterium]
MNLEITNDGIAVLNLERSVASLEVLRDLGQRLDQIDKRGDVKALQIHIISLQNLSAADFLQILRQPDELTVWQDAARSAIETIERITLPLYLSIRETIDGIGLILALKAVSIYSTEKQFLTVRRPHRDLPPAEASLDVLWNRAGWSATESILLGEDPSLLLRKLPVSIVPELVLKRHTLDQIRKDLKRNGMRRRYAIRTPRVLNRFLQRLARWKSSTVHKRDPLFAELVKFHQDCLRNEFSPAMYHAWARDLWMSPDTSNCLLHILNAEQVMHSVPLPETLHRVLAINSLPLSNDILQRCSHKRIRIKIVENRLESLQRFFKESSMDREMISASDRVAGITRADWILLGEREDHLLGDVSASLPNPVPITVLNIAQSMSQVHKTSQQPGFTIGLRITQPVAEIVSGSRTRKSVRDWLSQIMQALGWIPLPVSDGPGGVMKRLLAQLVNEALSLMEEGLTIGKIDAALAQIGGGEILKIADSIGNDALLVAAQETIRVRPHVFTLSDTFHILVERGHLGQRTEDGFYLYQDGKAVRENRKLYRYFGKTGRKLPEMDLEEIHERLLFILSQDALRILDEGTVQDPRILDVALASVIQFPRRYGGPLRYCEGLGWPHIAARLQEWSRDHSPRYLPSNTLMHLIESSKSIFEGES